MFAQRTSTNHTVYTYGELASVDWKYSDMLDAFVIVANPTPPTNSYVILKPANYLANLVDIAIVTVPGTVFEGPGLLGRPDGHLVASPSCGVLPIDIMRAVGSADPNTWDLSHHGLDLSTTLSCGCSRLDKVLDSYTMISSGLPLTVVVNGTRLQFQSSGPASRLSRNSIPVSAEVFHRVPYGASLLYGTPAYYTGGQPAAFEVDAGALWPVSCGGIVSDNGSSYAYLDPSAYAARNKGPALFCVQ